MAALSGQCVHADCPGLNIRQVIRVLNIFGIEEVR